MNSPLVVSGKASVAYPVALRHLVQHGSPVSPREQSTKELLNVTLHVVDPEKAIITPYGRPINLAFALAEVLWILGGRDDVETLAYFNSNISKYSDNGKTFNAAYGHRMRVNFVVDQLDDAVRKLFADPDTRQAVMSYTDPIKDNVDRSTKDRPCNITSQFLIRNSAVHLTQTMRSNDAMWGTPYNWVQWSHILRAVAHQLQVPVGTMTFQVGSFHLYDHQIEEATKVAPYQLWEASQDMSWNDFETPSQVEFEALQQLIHDSRKIHSILNEVNPFWYNYFQVFWTYRLFKEGKDQAAWANLVSHVPWPLSAMLAKNFYQWRWVKKAEHTVLAQHVREMFDNIDLKWLDV